MVSFEIFVKAMPPCLSELKVLPSFCFAFKIPDDVAASIKYLPEVDSIQIQNDQGVLGSLVLYILDMELAC
jgi:hypothetical protein